jgi:hypothetical protein
MRSLRFRSCSNGSPRRMGSKRPRLDRRHRDQPDRRYLLAVKANQPTLRAKIESLFNDADPADLDSTTDFDKGHGRIEPRIVTVARQVDWLGRRPAFPGEVRLPNVATVVKVASRVELKDRCRFEPRPLGHREQLAPGSRRHLGRRSIAPAQWARREKHGYIVRHCAINLVRTAKDKRSIKLRTPVGIPITSPKSSGI